MPHALYDLSRYHVYFAPRGKDRLLFLGDQLALRHLNYADKLIGIVGDSGSGKSSIIKGMFPGLELANDDDGLNPKKIMQIRDYLTDSYDTSTYHIDMRFQTAFTQMHEIVDFVRGALENNRRVIVEHFDLLYPSLQINAEILIGIGEEIILTRPSMFGPLPKDIYKIVFNSVKYRRIAHTAEDLTTLVLESEYGLKKRSWDNADVRRGFVLKFKEPPDLDLQELEDKVRELIAQDLTVNYYDENHIQIGEIVLKCNGPRIHVRSTGEITEFSLLKDFVHDVFHGTYSLVGLVGERSRQINDLNNLD